MPAAATIVARKNIEAHKDAARLIPLLEGKAARIKEDLAAVAKAKAEKAAAGA